MCIECFEAELDPDKLYDMWTRGGTTQVQVQEQVKRELEVLTALSELEPPIIPQVLGLWGGLQRGYQVWMMVMEDAGDGLYGDLGEEDINAVMSLYERLHAAGFLHGDGQRRHMCRMSAKSSDPSAIRLIDFDRAVTRAQLSEEEWLEQSKNECQSVLNGLRYSNEVGE
ncbi:hypothetical protein TREMEDRAFT_72119 [Tremella mesenterica DSM 1558]|uniref:uncharacterized protein n=1 Tax=Tremella mesenterica (strain ATCC 24925 / CBS 8224 / DSM 1558 / NBRC 9311 / NRRL Y-6157 / RJB 2259-6 / UBC 559-6) TaxID=578456 RepID=UPI0003F49852|nr:uncharacterized protein TREMEDRAFT_72119 [Tremella mesenterica DSM 1558]EIW68138.1 hypothetical protein TREMEDRAFT_72119 [Tremella mesenterica DSM 1558]